jgi:hypothetical protein
LQAVQEDRLVAHHFIRRYCNRLGCWLYQTWDMSTILLWYCYFRNFKIPGYFVTIYIILMEGFGKKLCFAIMQFLQKSVWCAIFNILLVTPIELLF